MLFKIVVLKNFANFTGRHLCRRLFCKVAGPQNCNFILKNTPVKFANFFRTTYFTEHLQWLFLTVSGFHPATLLKKRFPQRRFSVNFAKYLRTFFDRTSLDDCLSLSVNFKKFFRTSLL